jgi:hypothetical protein
MFDRFIVYHPAVRQNCTAVRVLCNKTLNYAMEPDGGQES